MVQFSNGRKVWDPWNDIAQLQQEVNRLFSGVRPGTRTATREFPPICLHTGEDDLLLTTEVPGINPAELEITVTGDTITLRGRRSAGEVKEGQSFHRQERPVGQFVRTVQLPFEVDPEKTEAHYEKGVLSVKMARPEQMKLKKVTVKSA